MDHYEALANAIVTQAVKDYRMAQRKLKVRPSSLMARDIVREVEAFFHSAWFGTLTAIDPNYILYKLRKEESGT